MSAIPALIEVGGSAVATFEPGNAAALAERLAALLDDPEERTRLAGASRAQARAFSWRETARRTAAAYRSTLAAGSGPA